MDLVMRVTGFGTYFLKKSKKFRDRENEIFGIKPDIWVDWDESDDKFTKGQLVINAILAHLLFTKDEERSFTP